ncbi:MAG TPA: pyridoxal-phosphate dependent enzyme [Alphaproteobacteria bacterium]|nr:pyridoxal-phosphate dependent enzyme [Alphaproteobacteria bacterium]
MTDSSSNPGVSLRAGKPPAILDLIGHTPLVELTRFDTGPCRLFLKLENQNPGGSIKDRIGLKMVEAAEREGKLKAGGTLVEATAGNTGLGLALAAAAKGYRLILVIPDKMALEKINHLKSLGVDIRITRSDVGKGHPEYYQDMAQRIAEEHQGFYVNQFANPANPLAHETGTGPEIFEQMDGDVDAVVVGVGSGGTLTGLGRFFAKASPKTKMVLADPKGSVLADLVETGKSGEAGSWVIEGIGEDFVPPVCDLALVGAVYRIGDAESLNTARDLLRLEGILGGSSSGTLLAAALRYCRDQTEPKRVVTLVCDSGNKYLSKQFNDFWMEEQGFLPRRPTGDLRDIIGRPHDEGGTVFVGPDDTLLTAYKRMRVNEVSQLPVLNAGKVVGLLDESDLLLRVVDDENRFTDPVRSAMTAKVETVPASATVETLLETFDRGHVAMVVGDDRFLGVITRIDLLNHLRRRMK